MINDLRMRLRHTVNQGLLSFTRDKIVHAVIEHNEIRDQAIELEARNDELARENTRLRAQIEGLSLDVQLLQDEKAALQIQLQEARG